MGLTTLPTRGTGNELGPTKINRPIDTVHPTHDLDASEWNAAAAALEGVCAEVGLTNGTTAGSLVERMDSTETATTAAQSAADAAQADADAAQADATQAIADAAAVAADLAAHEADVSTPVRIVATSTTITSADSGGVVVLTPTTSADLTATMAASLPLGFQVKIVRGAVGADKGRVLLDDANVGTISFAPRASIARDNGSLDLVLGVISGDDRTWLSDGPTPRPKVVTHSTGALTLTAAHDGYTILVDSSLASIPLTIADAIPDDWQCTVIRKGANSVTIAGESVQTCVGPAASAGTVTIGVDYGGVGLVRLSASETWAAGVTA